MNIKATILFVFISSLSLSGQNYFTYIPESSIQSDPSTDRNIIPSVYNTVSLDFDRLTQYLEKKVPSESDYKATKQMASLLLPDPDGRMKSYLIFETKIMQSGLAAKYPAIRTFKGFNANDKLERIHLGISPKGFYASISNQNDSYYIDKYSQKSNEVYLSYFTRDYSENENNAYCGTENRTDIPPIESQSTRRSGGENLPLRVYRLALACTGEFGAFFGPEKSSVLAEFVKSINRVNLITENDLAVRLVLIDDTDKLIFTDPDSDQYTGNSGGTLLGENSNVLNANVGFANYDIGHVYTRGCNDVGGVAFLRSVCSADKARGVTCHSSSDITSVAVRVAAHELGHQLGSNHTFNNCNGNENGGTAFEPGSGSTIMSYGGLCGSALNIVGTSSDYYHVSSLIEISNYTRDGLGDNCPELIETENHTPEVIIPYESGFSIPISTPFELTGVAIDSDGDEMTYNWEQYDLGPTSVPGTPQANSPLFMSQYPINTPTRIFPKIETILTNSQETSEVLPTYSRDLTFQFIARDNNLESGGVAWTEIKFKADDSAGPFLVEFPNGADTLTVGQEIEILWDVANTDNEIINCKNVDIYLSENGGLNFEKLLVESTANDGKESVFIPNNVGNNIRIKIKARNSIFFDVSNENFSIVEPTEPGFVLDYDKGYFENCVPDEIILNFNAEGLLGYDKPIKLEVGSGLEEGMDFQFEKAEILPGESTSASISFQDISISGIKTITILASSEGDTIKRDIILDLVSSDFSDIDALFPFKGSSGVIVSPILMWSPDGDAAQYIFRLADNPSFLEENTSIFYEEILNDTFFVLDDILAKNKVYYWTIQGTNDCKTQENPEIYTFATEAISCIVYNYNDVPAPISQSGIIELEMPIEVNSAGQVADVNIARLRGAHSWVSELKGELVSPAGTVVKLFDKECLGTSDFNCGFDDDATTDVICPFNQGIFYTPSEPLDTFNGEDISGEWLLKLTDKAIGNGGSVQEYKLELCSNVSLSSPYIVNNEEMPLPSGVGRRISTEFLLSEDDDNTGDELIYTLVVLPASGILRKNNDTLMVGSQFTQEELNALNIRYQHDGNNSQDSFIFVVQDGDGGWIDRTSFLIRIDNDVSLDVEDLNTIGFNIFPNPSKGIISIRFSEAISDANFEVYNLAGQRMNFSLNGYGDQYEIEIGDASDGIYFLSVRGSDINLVTKVIVKR